MERANIRAKMATWFYYGLRYVDCGTCECLSVAIGPKVAEYEQWLREAGLGFEDIFTDPLETTQSKWRAFGKNRTRKLSRTCPQSRDHRPAGYVEQRKGLKSAIEEKICLDWDRML